MTNKFALCLGAALLGSAMLSSVPQADACTRVLYVGGDSELRIVGRSLDWKTPIPTNIYVYPRGMAKVGDSGDRAMRWTSRYGAVYAVSYDSGVTEGMNEQGLVVNGLFCKGTIYSKPGEDVGKRSMSLAMLVAWMLDNYATTPELVEALRHEPFVIAGSTFDGGTVTALHWGISDAKGNSAILEYVNGVMTIHEGQDLPVLTNDPTYPQMSAIENYWRGIGGANFLPGGVRSPDRFVRADFFDRNVVHTAAPDTALAVCRSILNNASVPYLYTVDGEPNVSSTQWRSFSVTPQMHYWFDIVTNPGMFYVDLKACNLKPGAPVLKLDTSKSSTYVGDATSHLEPVPPFKPMF